jgi:hypothetical protein
MMGLFTWRARQGGAPLDTSALGTTALAMPLAAPLPSNCTVPKACIGLIVDAGGRTRRVAEGARLSICAGEQAWCYHPGPYSADLCPFAAAPEIGLRLAFTVDCPDPRIAQQRFDLYLASEAREGIALDAFCAAIEAALQRELAQGGLDLPPCTTLDEWNTFRAGFNQLLYTRFGVTVDDCIPVDLSNSVDFARLLAARVGAAASETPAVSTPICGSADTDRYALRRLFLELPSVMCGLRLAVLPPGQQLFRQHQALLQRLDLASLSVNTMPALELAAPGQPLDDAAQARRIAHSRRALAALDEAWSLLARLRHAAASELGALFDDGDRIIANLETALAARRVTDESEAP